ncbi:hypothetical protein ABMA10_00390 [Plantibacter sp. RU18]
MAWGRGFHPQYDDDTDGQARHFAGTVAVCARLGGPLTLWLSIHLLKDEAGSADEALAKAAVTFTTRIRRGQLSPADAPEWIRRNICHPPA